TEQAERPRLGVHLRVDAVHVVQVVAPHRDDAHVGGSGVDHADSRVDQLMSASGLRRYSGLMSHGFTNSSRSAFACASCTSASALGNAKPWSAISTLRSPSNTSR